MLGREYGMAMAERSVPLADTVQAFIFFRNTVLEAASHTSWNRILELADKNIQVNALGPGSIHTRMWEEITDGARESGDSDLYEFGLQVTGGGGASIDRAAELAVWLAGESSRGLSGRMIHAVSDDFTNLTPLIPQIMASDLYTLRRDEPPRDQTRPNSPV